MFRLWSISEMSRTILGDVSVLEAPVGSATDQDEFDGGVEVRVQEGNDRPSARECS
jgi:hypothetical protein